MIQTFYTFLCLLKVLKYLEVSKVTLSVTFSLLSTSRTQHFDSHVFQLILFLPSSSRIHKFMKTSVLCDSFKYKFSQSGQPVHELKSRNHTWVCNSVPLWRIFPTSLPSNPSFSRNLNFFTENFCGSIGALLQMIQISDYVTKVSGNCGRRWSWHDDVVMLSNTTHGESFSVIR